MLVVLSYMASPLVCPIQYPAAASRDQPMTVRLCLDLLWAVEKARMDQNGLVSETQPHSLSTRRIANFSALTYRDIAWSGQATHCWSLHDVSSISTTGNVVNMVADALNLE